MSSITSNKLFEIKLITINEIIFKFNKLVKLLITF